LRGLGREISRALTKRVDFAALTEGFLTERRKAGRDLACAAIFFFISYPL
jgi:hypothetical protein